MYRKQVRRRRAVLVVLIVAALVLLSTQFSESQGGPLHSMQRAVASVFAPLEEGATRALKPARDLINWVDETFQARGQNSDLHSQVQQLRTQLATAQGAEGENQQLRKLLGLDRQGTLAGYKPVTARVIGRSPTVWYSTVTRHRPVGAVVVEADQVLGDGVGDRRVAPPVLQLQDDQVGLLAGGPSYPSLQAFLEVDRARPLTAYVAVQNVASRRVLEKVGFSVVERRLADGIEEDVLRRTAP